MWFHALRYWSIYFLDSYASFCFTPLEYANGWRNKPFGFGYFRRTVVLTARIWIWTHTHNFDQPFFLSIVQCIINSNSIASHVQAFRCLYQMSSLTLWIHAHGIVHRNVTKFEFTPKENDLLWFGNRFLKRFFQISRILNVADFYSPALAAHLLGVVSSHEVVLSI